MAGGEKSAAHEQPTDKVLHKQRRLLSVAATIQGISVVIAILLGFFNLGHVALWDDEAYVAFVARNFNRFGRFTSWDGRNLYGLDNGTYLDPHLHIRIPNLDNFVVAIMFRIFGESLFVCRLPFALFGLASIGLFWQIVRHRFPENATLQTIVFSSLTLSTAFLLNFRTCRYYTIAIFCVLAMYLFYHRFLEYRRLRDALSVSVAATALFYCNYLICGAILLPLLITYFIFYHHKLKGQGALQISAAAILFLGLCLPYALINQIWIRSGTDRSLEEVGYGMALYRYMVGVDLTNTLPWALVLIIVAFWRRDIDQRIRLTVLEWSIWTVLYVGIVAIVSHNEVSLRYLTGMFPFMAGLGGFSIWLVYLRSRWSAVALFAIWTCSNVLSLVPNSMASPYPALATHPRALLPSFVREVIHPYPTANSEVADYLHVYAAKDDIVVTSPQYYSPSLIWADGAQLRVAGLLNRQTQLDYGAQRLLPPYIFKETAVPTWIVLYGLTPDNIGVLQSYSRSVQTSGLGTGYDLAKILNVYSDQTQRPEIPYHLFGPAKGFDEATQAVYIFRLRKTHGLP